MKTGKLSGLIFIVILFLTMLLTGCDSRSDDGVITVSDNGNVTLIIIGVVLVITGFVIAYIADVKDTVLFTVGFLALVIGLLMTIIGVWKQSQVSAINSPEYKKEYVYKQMPDSTYVVKDSIYIRIFK